LRADELDSCSLRGMREKRIGGTLAATDADPHSQRRHQHECQGRREGGWIVYSCPNCDYEMRKNPLSGELIVRNMKPSVRHYGSLARNRFARTRELN